MSKKQVTREARDTQEQLKRIRKWNKQAGRPLMGYEILTKERDRVRVKK